MLRFTDAMAGYSASADLALGWDYYHSSYAALSAGTGPNSENRVSMLAVPSQVYSGGLRKIFRPPVTGTPTSGVGNKKAAVAFGYENDTTSVTAPYTQIIGLGGALNAGGVPAYNLLMWNNSAGYPVFARANDTNTILASGGYSGVNLRDGQRHWLEVDFYSHASSGYIKLWIDGILDMSFTGNTVNGGSTYEMDVCTLVLSTASHGGSVHSGLCYYDNIIVYDGDAETGGLVAGTSAPIGPSRVTRCLPDGAGNSAQFTASTGSNYACVDESVPSSSDHVQGVAGLIDLYTHAALSYSPASIKGLLVKAYAKNPGGGTINIRGKARSSSTNGNGDTKAVSPAYSTICSSIPVNPDGSVAWTEATINAAEFGFESVA